MALAHLEEGSDLFSSTELLLPSIAQALLCAVGVFNELSQMWDVSAEPGRGSVALLGIVLSPHTFFIALQPDSNLTPVPLLVTCSFTKGSGLFSENCNYVAVVAFFCCCSLVWEGVNPVEA